MFLLGLSLSPHAGGAQESPSAGPEARDDIGYVGSVTGTWLVHGDTVRVGRAVLRTDTIIPPPDPIPSARLGIILTSGQRIVALCDLPGGCRQLLVPADSIRRDSWSERLSRIVHAVRAVMRDAPERYESLISRGASLPEEAVLGIESGRVDLEPLMAGWPSGRYVLSFYELRGDPPDSVGPLEANWDAERPTPIEHPGLTPSLYEVTFAHAPDPYLRGAKTWILLAGPGTLEETRSAFEEARAITEAWGESALEARAFLRAYLDVLAREGTH